ncbi:MAG: S1C family serine protease [Planctomycetia bacterium]
MAARRRFLGRGCSAWRLVAAALLPLAAPCSGEEPPPLAPVPAVIGPQAERPDPLAAPRLSTADRDRLYAQLAQDAEFLERHGRHLRRLSQLLRPTVVHIAATKPRSRPRSGKTTEEEAGSGVIATVAGRTVVITNRHVVHRADLEDISLRLDDGRHLHPERLWSDADTDIAVMEIGADDLQTARFAEEDTLQIGDAVVAIGSPFGLAQTVTLGIVSAKGRRDLDLGEGRVRFQDFIQTDAAINPGNSGGPLVNIRGEVVGLNTAIASNSGGSEGIGFAIPISLVIFVSRQLVEHGQVQRAFLGVSLDRVFSPQHADRLGMPRPVGALVIGVTPGAPADRAGIRRDDVIIAYDGRPVDDDDHLLSLVSTTPLGRTVDVVIFRERSRSTLRLTVASRRDFEP